VRIIREPSPAPTAQNCENIRLDMSHSEGGILQSLMLEIQGLKGWCQRDMRVQEFVTNLVVHLPTPSRPSVAKGRSEK
jgi:hypothetical protein